MKHIDRAREVLSTKITSLLGESYNRAYQQIKELQFLKELEEVIEYKKTNSQEKKTNLYKCWINRQKSMPSHDLEAH
jgi:FKBP12-rapamycin complex-associated protein